MPFPLEHPGDAVRWPPDCRHGLRDFANLARRAVAVFGEDVAHDGDAGRTVPFVDQLGELFAFEPPEPFLTARSMFSLGMLCSRALSMA